jgi:hypothetical protein
MIIKNHDYGNLVTNNNQIDTIMGCHVSVMTNPKNDGQTSQPWRFLRKKKKNYQSNDGGERFQAIKNEAVNI